MPGGIQNFHTAPHGKGPLNRKPAVPKVNPKSLTAGEAIDASKICFFFGHPEIAHFCLTSWIQKGLLFSKAFCIVDFDE